MSVFGKPRLVRLGELAFRAELLRRRRQVRGYALRAASGGAATIFAVMAVLGLHLAAWASMARLIGPAWAALGVAAFDLALCLGLGRLAAGQRADRTADEAVAVRNAALRGARMEAQTLGGLLRRPGGGLPSAQGRRVRVHPP